MADSDHAGYLQQAIQLANQGVEDDRGGPFGAVVVLDGRVIGTGCNQVTSLNDPTAHAEVLAIRAACQQLGRFHLKGAILYASCEPCPMCLSAAYWAHVKAVYYACGTEHAASVGFDDARIYAELERAAGDRDLEMIMLPVANARAPLERWSRSTTKQMY